MAIQEVQMSFKLPYSIKKDGNYFVSSCPVLDIFSQGSTEKEAIENLEEALKLFLETCFEMGTLNEVLKKRGFEPKKVTKQIRIKEFPYLDVPVSLAMSRKNAEACAY